MADIFIPDEIYWYITEYLSVCDCMSFALSGVSPRFVDFFTRLRGFDFNLCYGLKEELCKRYLNLSNQVNKILSLDLGNCYWFSDQSLLASTSNLFNLSELNVIGTVLSLSLVISKVLPHCQGLSRISAPIVEETWVEFETNIGEITQTLPEKLKLIHYLELHILKRNTPNLFMLLLKFLRWCVACKELRLSFSVPEPFDPDDQDDYDSSDRVIRQCRQELYSKLEWMTSLQVLSIKNKRSERCLDDWCHWLLNEMNPTSLEQVWLPHVRTVTVPNHNQTMGLLRALCLDRLEGRRLNTSALEQLTHLGGVSLPLSAPIPHLRFIQAYCSSYTDLDNFCQSHTELEHLHFDSQACYASEGSSIQFEDRWSLTGLKSLVYASNKPHPDVLEQFVRSCPELEALHIGWSLADNLFLQDGLRDDAYWSISRLKHLKKLTISGIEFTRGTFLRQVLTGCSQLEVLHLAGSFEGEMTFHEDVCRCLPLAKELRDFRYQRDEIRCSDLTQLLSALGSCRRLQRVFIRKDACWSDPIDADTQHVIYSLIDSALPELQMFCLVYPAKARVIEDLNAVVKEKLLPLRPSFWFHIGDAVPRGKQVPQVHYDEMIDPDYFSSVPSF